MKERGHRIWAATPRGTRWLLVAWVGLGALSFLRMGGSGWLHSLVLTPQKVWDAQVWRLVTYALVPPDLFSWLFGAIFLWGIGTAVERVWSPRDLVVVYAAGAGISGVVICVVAPWVRGFLGNVGALLALLVVWWHLYRFQRFQLFLGPAVSGNVAAWIMAALMILPGIACNGPIALAFASGAVGGAAFLAWSQLRSRRADGSSGVSRASRIEF